MNTYQIFSIADNSLVWTCKAETEKIAWETLEVVKKIPTIELKKIFKIEKKC
jgi:hypothetical protein